jgi:hypothetical protein
VEINNTKPAFAHLDYWWAKSGQQNFFTLYQLIAFFVLGLRHTCKAKEFSPTSKMTKAMLASSGCPI